MSGGDGRVGVLRRPTGRKPSRGGRRPRGGTSLGLFGAGDEADSKSRSQRKQFVTSFGEAAEVSEAKQAKETANTPSNNEEGRTQQASNVSQIERLVAERRKDLGAQHLDEEAAFKRDLERRPDAADNDAYLTTPVIGFGESMLRMMGWNEKTSVALPKAAETRGHLLGLGAKVSTAAPPSRAGQAHPVVPKGEELRTPPAQPSREPESKRRKT